MNLSSRLDNLEKSILPRDEPGRCPHCRERIYLIGVSDAGEKHCGHCGQKLGEELVPRNVKALSLELVLEL